jgi:3-oxoacyl-[acyl-carrier protein] reductase
MDGSVLQGKKALVTGGAGGLGVAECETLARYGADVVMFDLPKSAGLKEAAGINERLGAERVRFVTGDLKLLKESKAQVQALDAEVGGFDILVNNAAINPLDPIENYAIDYFEDVQRINTHAAFVLSQAVVPGMKKKGAGQIVNICSITLSGGWSDFVPYVMSKGSLLGLTRSLARELGPSNIRVNCVSPGAIPTELERQVWAHKLEEYERFILDRQSLKFRATAQDIADAMFFLVSPLSRFVTGIELHVNGGWYMG